MVAQRAGVYIALAIAIVAMAALLSGGLILHSALPALASRLYPEHFSNGTAGISVLVMGSPLMVNNLLLTLSGNGFNESIPITLGPYSAVTGQAQQGSIPRARTNVTNSSIMPRNTYTATFAGLKPYSTYALTLSGSARPYCQPGVACPQFIVRVYQHESVMTGAPGTLGHYTISAFGAFNQSYNQSNGALPNMTEFNRYPECGSGALGQALPEFIRNVSYVTCAPGQRLVNFLLHSVNANGTVTVYYYTYTPVTYGGWLPTVRIVAIGQQAGYTCQGEAAYLNATDSNMGTAVFKLVKGRPIPCPV